MGLSSAEQHVLAQRPFELVGVPAAVRVVNLIPAVLQISPQPVRELRREADLHRAAVGFFVIERHPNSIPVLHPKFLLIDQ
jgi:hypothetical protein